MKYLPNNCYIFFDMETLCKVCHDGNIVQGKYFCEACRTFFRRTHNLGSDKPVCKTGLYQCLSGEKDFRRQDGASFRFLCRACRYEKCLAVSGLPSKLNEKQMKNSPVHSMHDRDNDQFEMLLTTIMMATMNLSNEMKNTPLKAMRMQSQRHIENRRKFAQTFDERFSLVTNFASKFQLLSNLNAGDRIKLFLTSKFRVIAGEGLIQYNDFTLACVPSAQVAKAFEVIPSHLRAKSLFKTAYYEALNSWQRIKGLQFTPIENAFFITLLFFDGKSIAVECP